MYNSIVSCLCDGLPLVEGGQFLYFFLFKVEEIADRSTVHVRCCDDHGNSGGLCE